LEISEKDFISAIKEHPPSAVAGPDELPVILLRNCKGELSSSTPLLNRIKALREALSQSN